MQLTAKEIQKLIYKNLYKKSLYDFVKDFWKYADPEPFVDCRHLRFFCELFQYMCRKWTGVGAKENIVIPEEYKNFKIINPAAEDKNKWNINLPPRHCKSMIFNVFGPVWLWLSYPIKAVSISHTQDLAKTMNSKRYSIVNSPLFKELFGDEIKLMTNTAEAMKDNRGGELYSQNRNAMTGYGGDFIINDDLTNAQVAAKDQEEMANAWAYYNNTMPSRINNPQKYVILNVQQRLAPNDITGHIQANPTLASTYAFIVIPAVFEEDTILVCPMTGTLLVFHKGDGLWSERYGNYEGVRLGLDSDGVFQSQYLQKPIASDRTIIKPDMIREIDACDAPDIHQAEMIYASHDFPIKDKETSDYLGSIIGYKAGSTLYIYDCLEERQSFVRSVQYVESLEDIYPGIVQIVEDKANGAPIIQQLQQQVPAIIPYNPGTNSKVQRAESITVYLNAGNIKFVKTKFDKTSSKYVFSSGMQTLVSKLLAFPFVEHDDVVDAFTQLVSYSYLERRLSVYGKALNDFNFTEEPKGKGYSNIFFNKEGDLWKVAEIEVFYSNETKIYVKREIQFKADLNEGLAQIKQFAPKAKVIVDVSQDDALGGLYSKDFTIVHEKVRDFEKSVSDLNLSLGMKTTLLNKDCVLTKADLDNFRFAKTKDETARFKTQKDGFVACIRIARKYYGL